MNTSDSIRFAGRILLAGLSATTSFAAHADAGTTAYQGYLTSTQGVAITDTVEVAARIYDGTGVLLYGETHADIAVTQGLFRIAIGSGAPYSGVFDAGLFQGAAPAAELEIAINGETLAPRRPLRSVPYAQAASRADDADTLEGSPREDFVIRDSGGIQTIADGAFVIDGVADSVETAGDYRYGTPRTYRYAVTADRFAAGGFSQDWNLEDQLGFYRYTLSTATQRSHAGLNLPAGARPTRFMCHYYDANTFATIEFLFARLKYRVPDEPSAYQSVASLQADSVFPTSSTDVRTSSVNLGGFELPAGAPLQIELQYRVDNGSSALRFYGCDVEYTLDRVSSP